MQSLEQLFYLYGIGYEYTKYTGEHVIFSEATRKAALDCCNIDSQNDSSVDALNFALDAAKWQQLVSPVSIVFERNAFLKVRVSHSAYDAQQALTVSIQEQKSVLTESLAALTVTGNYMINGCNYLEVQFPLPRLVVGYYNAEVSLNDQLVETQIWVTPEQSFQVAAEKRVGLSIQLYSLKNNAGQGIGDFQDLLNLVEQSAKYGLDYILLSPLHLLFQDEPMRASPYSPSSRALLNPLYIAVNLSVDAVDNHTLDSYLMSTDYLHLQQELKDNQFIDYEKVSACKYKLLALLFSNFRAHADVLRQQQFTDFCSVHRATLASLTSTDTEFAYYLQWQAHLQLATCQQSSREQGMAIGLINDLAVGCAGDGSEYLSQKSLFTDSAYVGAPPDPWAEQGQNWGLPALDPQKIATERFAFYRALIRANMENVGGLRIDHVMAIRRLWWCFETQGQPDGCYVYYPFEQLLAILKIESHLNKCILIGEDLGVVPPEVKTALNDSAIFSNSLFYFEKDSQGNFLNVEHFAAQSLLMVANHDVPPFYGWWQKNDITTKLQYGLITTEQQVELMNLRDIEKSRLLSFLHTATGVDFTLQSDAGDIYAALVEQLACAPAYLLALQLDDLDKQTLSVNIPGTDKEYPNWRRVLSNSSDVILKQNADLLTAIKNKRMN